MATTATKKTAAPATKKAAPASKKAAAPAAKKAAAPAVKKPVVAAAPLKPIKDSFTKASLTIHLAERSGVEPKAAKALLAALEETVLASIHKKGAKEFTLPGLLKPFALLSVTAVLLLIEPDFGAATVLFATGFAVLFIAGARLRYVAL